MAKRSARRKKNEIKEEVMKEITDFEIEKEEKLLNLLAEIIVKFTLKEYYEKSDKISQV